MTGSFQSAQTPGRVPAGAEACAFASPEASALQRISARVALLVILTAVLGGCSHKPAPFVMPAAALAPVDVEPLPEPENPPVIAEEPPVAVPPLPPPAPRPVVRRRPAPVKEAPPPAQVAGAEPSAVAIGALSSGEDSTPQTRQQIKDLIVSIQKRLAALPGKLASQQKSEVSQVSRFLKQALQALSSGDSEGARNLATKAKLLMDDIEKK